MARLCLHFLVVHMLATCLKRTWSKIIPDMKLDFKDVLILPRPSSLNSRSEVSLIRHFPRFKHSTQSLDCVPICAANMDTTGTFEMAAALAEHKLLTAISKHYTLEQWAEFGRTQP